MRKGYYITTALMLIIAIFTTMTVKAQSAADPLPIDPKVRYGKLDNGLTYYIRHNEQPKERADFYIAQNVGSILEEENQRGLAHFLEHMAFDGSLNFPNNGMDDYIESVGMRSGENFNAYTSFDETVYMITNAPVNRSGVVDSCLLILHDWSGFLSLTDSAIRKERGVIREEWRTRQDAQARLWEQQLPKIFPGSKYANRMPIGSIDVIENFKPEELRAYYKRWYRPDLQALIIVGDLDVDSVENSIKRIFDDVNAPANPAKRTWEIVPNNDEPLISIAKDKEASSTIIYLFHKHDNMPMELRGTINGLVNDYFQQICSLIMSERFDDILHQANPPFIYAEAYDDDNFMIAKSKGAWTVAALAKEGEIDSTLTTMVKETERVRRFGFTASEYDRARTNLLKQYEASFNECDKQKNSRYVNEYVSHFTNGGYIPGIEMEYSIMNQIAPSISVEHVNQFIQGMIGEKNIVIGITGPDKEGVIYPTEDKLLDIYNRAKAMEVEPHKEIVSNEPLISLLPAPGSIVDSRSDKRFGATLLTLSNGVRVVLKQTKFKSDEILMTATSPGGMTLFGKSDVENLKLFNEVMEIGGLGSFSTNELGKQLAGKNVSCSISVGEDNESVNGSSSKSDIKTLFELIYLNFTAPRVDEEAYSSFETRIKAQLHNMELNPMVAYSDSLSRALYGDNPRTERLKNDDFNSISYKRIMEMRSERFRDASDFLFTFIGNIEMDSIKPLIEQYLATLPSIKRIEKGDISKVPSRRKGEFINHFSRKMEVPKVSVAHIYSGDMEYNLENLVTATALKQILDIVFYDNVREKEGGTYSVGVSAGISSFPEGRTTLQIFFDTDPAKWEQMNSIVKGELKRISENSPREEDFKKTQDNMLKRNSEYLEDNSYWLSILDDYFYKGFDRNSELESIVKGLTPDKIKNFAKRLLQQNNHIELVMMPE